MLRMTIRYAVKNTLIGKFLPIKDINYPSYPNNCTFRKSDPVKPNNPAMYYIVYCLLYLVSLLP